jgi:hypothetical protein
MVFIALPPYLAEEQNITKKFYLGLENLEEMQYNTK